MQEGEDGAALGYLPSIFSFLNFVASGNILFKINLNFFSWSSSHNHFAFVLKLSSERQVLFSEILFSQASEVSGK